MAKQRTSDPLMAVVYVLVAAIVVVQVLAWLAIL